MFVELPNDHELSIIGPGDGWESSPSFAPVASIVDKFAGLFGMPTTEVRSDGRTNWEVCSRRASDHDVKVVIPEWMDRRLPPPLTDEKWEIYGHVPTEELAQFIEANGGDSTEFRKWAGTTMQAEQ